MSNDQNFVNALAQSQSQRNQLAAQGWTEEGARQAARDEAFADLDPHGDEIGFPAHVAAFIIGATALGLGIGFFVPLVAEANKSGKEGTTALDDPTILIPLIAAIAGLFMMMASSSWLFRDYQQNRCSCGSNMKVMPIDATDLEAQNQILSPVEALAKANRESREKDRKIQQERKKQLPKTILFANDRVLLLLELFNYYTVALDVPEIGCNGLTEMMKDTMTGADDEISLQESRSFMNRIDLDGDKMVQRNEYLDFMLSRWSTESPLAKKFSSFDDFLVKLHEMRIVKNSGKEGRPLRAPIMSPSGGIPARLVEEQELGNLEATEKKLLHHEIVKDLFKWYDKDGTDAIDCNALLALMSDLVVDTSSGGLSIGDTNKFMGLIDQDGDRLLQEDELVSYMMERWAETAPKAEKFNKDVAAFLSVVYPIVQRKLLARWRAERGISPPVPSRAPPPPAGAPPPPAGAPPKQEKKKKKKKKEEKKKNSYNNHVQIPQSFAPWTPK